MSAAWASDLSPPADNAAFARLMQQHSSLNRSLLDYVYPTSASFSRNPTVGWVAYTENCKPVNDCYCFHVAGDMSYSKDPNAWQRCMHHHTWPNVGTCPEAQTNRRLRSCGCLTDRSAVDVGDRFARATPAEKIRMAPCLYSDMRPSKLLAVVTAARAAGVTHIVEEGRYGGLTALLYALHGFCVTSIEFLPLSGVSRALTLLAGDSVRQLEGDGSVLVPQLIDAMSDDEAARTLVIFDGEKRLEAFRTFEKLRGRVPLAVFDDTDNGEQRPTDEDYGPRLWERSGFFRALNATRHVWWSTWDPGFAPFLEREGPALEMLEPLQRLRAANGKELKWWGGVKALSGHFTIVSNPPGRGAGTASSPLRSRRGPKALGKATHASSRPRRWAEQPTGRRLARASDSWRDAAGW